MKTRSAFTRLSLAFVLLTTVVLATSAHAQSEIHLKISTVPGESVSALHKDEIVLTSYSFGLSVSNSASGGGAGVGKPIYTDIYITKNLDRATPKLMELAVSSKHIPSAILTVSASPDGRPVDFYTITLEDVFITSYSNSGASGSSRPADSLTLSYSRAVIAYKYYDSKGGLKETVTTTLTR